MVYCAAMMKEEVSGVARAGYLIVEITALYLKNLEEIFKFPSFAMPVVKGVFRDEGAVFFRQPTLEGIGRATLELLGSIPDLRVVPDLPGELKLLVRQERERHSFQCSIEALAPKHGRKMFSWRAVPTGLFGVNDRPGYRSEPAFLDKGAIEPLSEMIGSLLGKIR
jgi:hypothetical protein